MNPIVKITLNIDEVIGVNRYKVDEESAHIELVDAPSLKELRKLVLLCPAGLYKIDEAEKLSFDYAGCLECGTCRIACGDTIIRKWDMPQPTKGVAYQFG